MKTKHELIQNIWDTLNSEGYVFSEDSDDRVTTILTRIFQLADEYLFMETVK